MITIEESNNFIPPMFVMKTVRSKGQHDVSSLEISPRVLHFCDFYLIIYIISLTIYCTSHLYDLQHTYVLIIHAWVYLLVSAQVQKCTIHTCQLNFYITFA